jgi:DNA-binding CsgD family transcriptional regulator
VTQSLFRKTQGLIELLAKDPLRAHVISFLSSEMGSTGEPTAVAFLQLSRDGALHVLSHQGFSNFDPSTISWIDINSDRAVSETLRGGRLRIFTLEERGAQGSDLPKELQDNWQSSVAIPIGLQSIYFLNFREDVNTSQGFEEFIQCIGSLLAIFELHLNEKMNGKRELWFNEKSQSLSPREQRIVELIREGKTNPEIAALLGYSESLIRQETVSIYRKLGVSGRKEIRGTDSTTNRIPRNVIRAAIALSGIETLQPVIEGLGQMQGIII